MMTTTIVAHTEDHETIDCPHCGTALCYRYPAPEADGEACTSTSYVTRQDHVLNCGGFGPCLGCGTDAGEACICGYWPVCCPQ